MPRPSFICIGVKLYKRTGDLAATKYKVARDCSGTWYWKEDSKMIAVPGTKLAELIETGDWKKDAPKAYVAARDAFLSSNRIGLDLTPIEVNGRR